MPFKAERVKKFICTHCAEEIEGGDLVPLKSSVCPHCGESVIVPASFGNFHLYQNMGADDYGTVFKAFDTTLEREVGLRVLQATENQSEKMERFLEDARRLASLHHENTVRVFSIGSFHDQPYVEMELLTHGTAQKYLKKNRLLSEAEVLDFGLAIADGLRAAHKLGMVHLNVSPSRIMMDADNRPKLIDFGREGSAKSDESIQPYLAPEQIDAKAVGASAIDRRVDTFGLGATMYHMLSGHAPYPKLSNEGVDIRLEAEPPDIKDFCPDLNPKTAKLIKKMMAIRPDNRFDNDDAMVETMEAARLALIDEVAEELPVEDEDVMALAEAVDDESGDLTHLASRSLGASTSKSRKSRKTKRDTRRAAGSSTASRSGLRSATATTTSSRLTSTSRNRSIHTQDRARRKKGNQTLFFIGGAAAAFIAFLVMINISMRKPPVDNPIKQSGSGNQPPEIFVQQFKFNREQSVKVKAIDNESGPTGLTYEIISGRFEGYFEIDTFSGELQLKPLVPVPEEGLVTDLIIKVTDDSEPPLSNQAMVSVHVTADTSIQNVSVNNSKEAVKNITAPAQKLPPLPTFESLPEVDMRGLLYYFSFDGHPKAHNGKSFTLKTPAFDAKKMKVGQALNFGPSDPRLHHQTGDAFKGGLTFVTWVRWQHLNASQKYLRLFEFSNGPNTNSIIFAQDKNSKRLQFYMFGDGELKNRALNLTTGDVMQKWSWQHYAVTLDRASKEAKIYKDGRVIKAGRMSRAVEDVNRIMRFGRSSYPGDSRFGGHMDEMYIFARALAKEEVIKLFLEQTPYIKLDEIEANALELAEKDKASEPSSIKQVSATDVNSDVASAAKAPAPTPAPGMQVPAAKDNSDARAANIPISQDRLLYYFSFDDHLNSFDGQKLNVTGQANYQPGKIGKAFDFSRGKLTLDGTLKAPLNEGISFVAWVKWPAKKSAFSRLIDFSNGADQKNIIVGRNALTDQIRLFVKTRRKPSTLHTENLIKPQWQHVAATFSNKRDARIYINGKLTASNKLFNRPDSDVRKLVYFGHSPYDSGNQFKGWMDEVYVFNRSLAAEEIVTLMKVADAARQTGNTPLKPVNDESSKPVVKPSAKQALARATPVHAVSSRGSSYQKSDTSFLFKASRGPNDKYSLTFQTDMPEISMLRLHFAPDASLPGNGPGRHRDGRFSIKEIAVAATDISGKNYKPLGIASVSAAPEKQTGIQALFDGDTKKEAWAAPSPKGAIHGLTMKLDKPVKNDQGHRIKVVIFQRFAVGKIVLQTSRGSPGHMTNFKYQDKAYVVDEIELKDKASSSKVKFEDDMPSVKLAAKQPPAAKQKTPSKPAVKKPANKKTAPSIAAKTQTEKPEVPTVKPAPKLPYDPAKEKLANKQLLLAESKLKTRPQDAVSTLERIVYLYRGVPSAKKAQAKIDELKADAEWWQRMKQQAMDSKAKSLLKMGESYIRTGKYAAAKRELDKLIRDYPTSIYVSQARIQLSRIPSN